MNEIFTVAVYTFRRYIKNPVAIILFLLTPAFLFAFLGNSTVTTYISTVGGAPENFLENHIVSLSGTLRTSDRVCLCFMLMCLFYFSVLSCYSVINDLKNGIAKRFLSTPVSPLQNILGKFFGNFALIAGFTIVLAAIGSFLFGVKFGEAPLVTALALFLFDVIVNSLGILFSFFIRNVYVCMIFTFCINFPMMYSVMYSIYAPLKPSAVFTILKSISLHNYTLCAIASGAYSQLIPLAAAAVVILPLSLFLGKRTLR